MRHILVVWFRQIVGGLSWFGWREIGELVPEESESEGRRATKAGLPVTA